MSMSEHTKIPKWVSVQVYERDNHRCIVCGSHHGIPNSHIVRRSQGGRGIMENITTMCTECHRQYDLYNEDVRQATMDYIMSLYPNWTKELVTYHKHLNEVRNE